MPSFPFAQETLAVITCYDMSGCLSNGKLFIHLSLILGHPVEVSTDIYLRSMGPISEKDMASIIV